MFGHRDAQTTFDGLERGSVGRLIENPDRTGFSDGVNIVDRVRPLEPSDWVLPSIQLMAVTNLAFLTSDYSGMRGVRLK